MGGGKKTTFMPPVLNCDAGAVRWVGAWKKTSRVFMQDDLFKVPCLTDPGSYT